MQQDATEEATFYVTNGTITNSLYSNLLNALQQSISGQIEIQVASSTTLYGRNFAVYVKRFNAPALPQQRAAVSFSQNSIQIQLTGLTCSTYVAGFYYFTVKSSNSSTITFQ